MKGYQNVGVIDRLGRLAAGLVLIAVGLVATIAVGWKVAALAAGVVLLITAASGFCLAYLPFGINTQGRQLSETR